MKPLAFWQSLTSARKKSLARQCNTSVAYLSQIAHGHRRPSPALAFDIWRATHFTWKLKSLRPDIWK